MFDRKGYRYFDHDGVPLELGQEVLVQHCVGRYGQVRRICGKLTRIGRYGNVYIDTGREGEGNCLYPGFSADDSVGPNCMRGYERHVDFEHGHEKFIEVVRRYYITKRSVTTEAVGVSHIVKTPFTPNGTATPSRPKVFCGTDTSEMNWTLQPRASGPICKGCAKSTGLAAGSVR